MNGGRDITMPAMLPVLLLLLLLLLLLADADGFSAAAHYATTATGTAQPQQTPHVHIALRRWRKLQVYQNFGRRCVSKFTLKLL